MGAYERLLIKINEKIYQNLFFNINFKKNSIAKKKSKFVIFKVDCFDKTCDAFSVINFSDADCMCPLS